MSTTAKIKEELVRLLSLEENKAGLTVNQVWEKLEQTDFKEELYNSKGERRNGTLVGLTTRIKNGQVDGIKVVKNSTNNLVYVASSNQVEYLFNLTDKYLKEATAYKLKSTDFTVEQKKVIESYTKVLNTLKQESMKLKKVSEEITVNDLANQIKEKGLDTPKVENVKAEKVVETKVDTKQTEKEQAELKKKFMMTDTKVVENKARIETKKEAPKAETIKKDSKTTK